MKNKKKLGWVIFAAVVIIAAAAFYGTKSSGVGAEVLTLQKGEIEQYLEDTAQARPIHKQTIYVEGTGKVVTISVDVGDAVLQGDLLLSLEKEDLALQLKDAEAKIDAAKAQLEGTALKNYANQIEQAEAAVGQAENTFQSAKRTLENVKLLYEAEALSKKEFEDAQDMYDSALAVLNFKKLQLKDVKQGAPLYLKESYDAQLEQAIIYRDTILRNIQKQDVRAPIDGVVLEKLIDENAPALSSTPAFVIGDITSLELEAEVLADDAGKVKPGDAVEISGKAIGDAILYGKVKKIAPAAKTVTSSLGVNQKRVPVTIEIEDITGLVKPGYDLDIRIITAIKKDIIKVPDSAVFDYTSGSAVFVVENGKAVLRTVTKGIESGDDIEIQEGLSEGDVLLVKPDNSIKEGIKIKNSENK